VDDTVVRSHAGLEGEVVVLKGNGEAEESRIEDPECLDEEFLAGLVAVADDDGRR
jgi:hypothetical protein